jgi:bleomycin hydrolase
MMVKVWISALILLSFLSTLGFAQEEKEDTIMGYQFTPVIDLPVTGVKDQYRSGTCWSFSSLSFIESELLRMGKPEVDLSEMFVVWYCYAQKADRYVRMHGNLNFSGGGAFHDAAWVIGNFGMVPEEAFTGLTIGEDKPVHGEMDDVLKSNVESVIKNKNKKLSPIWYEAYKDLLNNYLGEIPASFEYQGEKYTPRSFADNFMNINADDYIEIGSYTHHPFYEPFIIEIPDNWLWGQIYNLPLDEMMETFDYALQNGFTIAWGADVSDKGFLSKTKGIAVVPDADITEMTDAEISKWEKKDEKEKEKQLYKLDSPGTEKVITQEMRQIDFDNYTSTDDHGMHIVGTAKDQNGTVYYKVKNSWGDYNEHGGYFYASKSYVALRTIDFMIHKDALPKKISKKLGL